MVNSRSGSSSVNGTARTARESTGRFWLAEPAGLRRQSSSGTGASLCSASSRGAVEFGAMTAYSRITP